MGSESLFNAEETMFIKEEVKNEPEDVNEVEEAFKMNCNKFNKYSPIYRTMDNIYYYVSNTSIILLSLTGIYILYKL